MSRTRSTASSESASHTDADGAAASPVRASLGLRKVPGPWQLLSFHRARITQTGLTEGPDQYDSPWKEALEKYFRSFLELCFLEAAQAIDWSGPVEFLDKDLQEIVRDAALGQQRVDKLVGVQLRDGTAECILIHVEVQHQKDLDLPLRVYQYHHRVCDRFGRSVVSLVILADEDPDWRPCHYEEAVLGCRVRFDFPICKLLDLLPRAQDAASKGEPSAVVVLANRAAQRTRKDMVERKNLKLDLTLRLYEAGLSRKDVWEIFRLIDWLLHLPAPLAREFKDQVRAYERKNLCRT